MVLRYQINKGRKRKGEKMKIAKLIDIAEDIIEIGETIKELAKEESYIDFHTRGAQLYLLANIIENAGEYYKVEAPGE